MNDPRLHVIWCITSVIYLLTYFNIENNPGNCIKDILELESNNFFRTQLNKLPDNPKAAIMDDYPEILSEEPKMLHISSPSKI